MKASPKGTKKIRKGDRVMVIAGNYRGMAGVVQLVDNDKAIVQGINMRKKHIKKSQEAPTGRIIQLEEPIHISNLKVCVEGDIPVKLKVRTNEQGERQFVYQNQGQEVVYRAVKQPK